MIKILFLIIVFIISGCSNKVASTSTDENTTSLNSNQENDDIAKENIVENSNVYINNLTGINIDENLFNNRPVAVVINNLEKSLPQSGIGQADLYYEVLAEGGITRLICIFKDINSQKIGPIRSVRDYFLNFIVDTDSILVHHGGSPKGYSEISNQKIDNLDGIELEGKTFWRDANRYKKRDMKEHSSYIDSNNIIKSIEMKKYNSKINNPQEGMFDFYDKFTTPENKEIVNNIKLKYSKFHTSYFQYNNNLGTYRRFQNDNIQLDDQTNKQLEVNNIIIQYVNVKNIQDDDLGRIEVKLTGEGKGYLLTGGTIQPIFWEKKSKTDKTEWFNTSKEKLKINKGKTWICVFPINGQIEKNTI